MQKSRNEEVVMTIRESNSGKWNMARTDTHLDMTVTTQRYDGAFAQPTSEETGISVPVLSTRMEQSTEKRAWSISSPYIPAQATRSLRILIVATEAPPVRGGIARVVGYLQESFQEHGHHVDVLAYPEVGRIVFGEFRLSGLIFKLPQLLRRINTYDVIHVHGTTPTISDVILLLSHLRGSRPLVLYTHHMDMDFKPVGFLNKFYNHLHHQLSTSADAVIASTQEYLRLLGNKCQSLVIPLGIDLEQFNTNEQKDARFTVLFVGQFRQYKGVHVLLQAMSQVKGIQLLLAGQGPEEQTYRSLAVELGVNVEFHIGVDDDRLLQLYERAHVVVLPSVSRLEAFGLVLLEGMASGCVPIASNLPGVSEVVGQNGFLFSTGNANHLAELLRGLRDDPELVQQLSNNARMHASKFDREYTVCEYERLIAGLIACRDLKNQLADQTYSWSSALHAFVVNIARILEADWTEMILCSTQGEHYHVDTMEQIPLTAHHQLQRTSSLLARYAINTGSSTLVGSNVGPLQLRNVVVREVSAAMVTPLIIQKEHFGALLSMRERPFEQHELTLLTHFARYVAPSLYDLMKSSIAKADHT